MLKKALTVVALAICVSACSAPSQHQKALAHAGYTDIVMTGRPGLMWLFSGCDDERDYATGFRATINGRRVTGVVCSGWFKPTIIRELY